MPGAIPIPVEALLPHLLPAFQEAMQAWLAQQQQPDPQYTIEATAGLLGVSIASVTEYLSLPASHPRRLPHVVTHDSNRGRRIPLSAITAWQQRNNCDALAQLEKPTSKPRPARRRG